MVVIEDREADKFPRKQACGPGWRALHEAWRSALLFKVG